MLRKVIVIAGSAAAVLSGVYATTANAAARHEGSPELQRAFKLEKIVYRPHLTRRVRGELRERGYYNIRFTDRKLPIYKVIACKRGSKFKMHTNRWGDIRYRKRIGSCKRPSVVKPFSLLAPHHRHERRKPGIYLYLPF
jgi:hypothetical protein